MFSKAFAIATLTLFGISHATPVPNAEPEAVPVQLPATQNTQVQIINLQATIVNLANDIVQANAANAKRDYSTADTQFKNIGNIVKTPTSYRCPPYNGGSRIITGPAAIAALKTTQENLMLLSLHLQDNRQTSRTINNDFCAAYTKFQSVKNYISTIIGTAANGASNAGITSFAASSYDPTKLGETYQASLIATNALITALNNIRTGQPSTSQAKNAWKKARDTLATYRQAANPANDPKGCPAVKLTAAKDSPSAIQYVKIAQQTVQSAYSDTTANNGKAFGDFCKINTYMTGVNAFVQA